jgi:hypothetical protein
LSSPKILAISRRCNSHQSKYKTTKLTIYVKVTGPGLLRPMTSTHVSAHKIVSHELFPSCVASYLGRYPIKLPQKRHRSPGTNILFSTNLRRMKAAFAGTAHSRFKQISNTACNILNGRVSIEDEAWISNVPPSRLLRKDHICDENKTCAPE